MKYCKQALEYDNTLEAARKMLEDLMMPVILQHNLGFTKKASVEKV